MVASRLDEVTTAEGGSGVHVIEMTALMPSSCDAAVSTDDNVACVSEVQARCEAVLAILVENKVESIKASSTAAAAANNRRSDSAPVTPRRRARIVSNSTQSSSQIQHAKHHHQRLRHHERHRNRKTSRISDCNQCQRYMHHKHHRRHYSAPSAGNYHSTLVCSTIMVIFRNVPPS